MVVNAQCSNLDDFRASLGKIVCAVSYFQNLLGTVFQCIIKLAISKCYGKVRVLFFRATTLVSTRKSHSSGVRGLVVRCLLFNPQGPCSNSGVWANFFLQVFRRRRLSLFRHNETPPFFRLCETFFRKFFIVLKGSSLQFVLIFCNRTNVKNAKVSLLSDFSAL